MGRAEDRLRYCWDCDTDRRLRFIPAGARELLIFREFGCQLSISTTWALYRAVCEYVETEKLFDDVTVVVVKVEPTEEEGAGGVATS